jgi:hypothetical protein
MKRSAFDAHPAWNALRQFEDDVSSYAEKTDRSVDADAVEQFRFLVAQIQSLREADPLPIASATLDGIATQLAGAHSNLEAFQSNPGNPPYLTAAEAHADAALAAVATLAGPALRGGAAGAANRAFEAYRAAAEQTERALRDRIRELEGDFSSKDAQSAALDQRLSELTAKITADEARLDTALVTSNETFTQSQTAREVAFKVFLEKYEVNLNEINEPVSEKLADAQVGAEGVLAKMEDLYEKVEGLSGKAAGAVLAGDYGAYALREWKTGITAIIAGFLAFIGGAVFVVMTISSLKPSDDVSWQYTTLKFGLTLTIVAAAVVAVRFGSEFLSKAHTAKRTELELKAIGLFLADVADADKVEQAKLDFVDRMFGRAWEDHAKSKPGEEINVPAIERLLDGFSKLIAR